MLIALKLFDSLISPIILYCSELWGFDVPLKDSDPDKHIHLKFLKKFLVYIMNQLMQPEEPN